jgi:succinate dehydrogenase / fumarate reductase flavoprotein subunit
MQGLADGYFVIPYTIGDYLAGVKPGPVDDSAPEFRQTEQDVLARINRLLNVKGKRTPTSIHRELGKIIWDECGMARNRSGLESALERLPALREEFWGT